MTILKPAYIKGEIAIPLLLKYNKYDTYWMLDIQLFCFSTVIYDKRISKVKSS